MSSLFDVSQQLFLILSLAAAGAAQAPTADASSSVVATRRDAEVARPIAFTDQRWLEGVSQAHDVTPLAARVFRTSGGRYYVPAAADRSQIAKLRVETSAAGSVAFALARSNAEALTPELGRAPTAGELYLAHCFGTETAVGLVREAVMRPHASLASIQPDLVARYPELRVSARDAVTRLMAPFDSGPSGADVAKWFRRDGAPAFAIGLKGSHREDAGPPPGTSFAHASRQAGGPEDVEASSAP